MELKARTTTNPKPTLSTNPFNGIERLDIFQHPQLLSCPPNPFNGIERLPSKYSLTFISWLKNPFNGIESSRLV
jgi:hypothetical protein